MTGPSASIALPAEPASARQGRQFAMATLADWGAAGAADAVALLVSELITNALLHARSSATVGLSLLEDVIRVEVCDRSPRLPRRHDYGPASSTGRGLVLLESLSSSWGVETRRHGKCVWFTVGAGPSPPGRSATVPAGRSATEPAGRSATEPAGRSATVGTADSTPFYLDAVEAL